MAKGNKEEKEMEKEIKEVETEIKEEEKAQILGHPNGIKSDEENSDENNPEGINSDEDIPDGIDEGTPFDWKFVSIIAIVAVFCLAIYAVNLQMTIDNQNQIIKESEHICTQEACDVNQALLLAYANDGKLFFNHIATQHKYYALMEDANRSPDVVTKLQQLFTQNYYAILASYNNKGITSALTSLNQCSVDLNKMYQTPAQDRNEFEIVAQQEKCNGVVKSLDEAIYLYMRGRYNT